VQPVIVAKSVDMNPLTVLLVILAGGKLFGILGMLLSVPIAGFIKVVLRESIINYRRYGAVWKYSALPNHRFFDNLYQMQHGFVPDLS